MALNDTRIRNARPQAKAYKMFDGGGLHLVINPQGSRLWRLKYRIGGREKLLSIGAYPAVGLKAAREAAKTLLAAGGDPSEQKKATKRAASTAAECSFRALADEYLAKLTAEGRAAVTLGKVEWLLGFANAEFGGQPIREITAPNVLACLRKVEQRGRHETARRLRSTIGAVFRFAVATARADTDPTFALRNALIRPTVTPMPAIIEPAEVGALARAIDGYKGQPTTVAALRLLLLLVPRPGELRQAFWEEFDFEARVWTIPPHIAKMRRPHRVPLPTQAIDILMDLREITGCCERVFPSIRTWKRPMSENTMNGALRRLGYSGEEVVSHGFRSTFSTLANESGLWHPDAVERALAHVEGNKVRRAYARGEHWDERVRMAQWWADHLDRLKADAAGVVVPIRAGVS